jgi:hypothetical protein
MQTVSFDGLLSNTRIYYKKFREELAVKFEENAGKVT